MACSCLAHLCPWPDVHTGLVQILPVSAFPLSKKRHRRPTRAGACPSPKHVGAILWLPLTHSRNPQRSLPQPDTIRFGRRLWKPCLSTHLVLSLSTCLPASHPRHPARGTSTGTIPEHTRHRDGSLIISVSSAPGHAENRHFAGSRHDRDQI